MADVNVDAIDNSPHAQPSAENLPESLKKQKPSTVRIPNKKIMAIKNWEADKNTTLSDVKTKMENVFKDLKDKNIFRAYERKGYIVPDSFTDSFNFAIKEYIYKLKKIDAGSKKSKEDEWKNTASNLSHLRHKLIHIGSKKRLLIDSELENAGHPNINDDIISALRFAEEFARKKAKEWRAKRVAGPRARSYLIERLADDLESSLKRPLPRTLEIHKDSEGRESFNSPFAELLWELVKCLDPDIGARSVRSVLDRLSRK